MQLSDYANQLPVNEKQRYETKLRPIGFDPYTIDFSQVPSNEQDFPDITYPDIVNYLVLQTSWITMDKIKAYKSLESYNYFISGLVHGVRWMDCKNDRNDKAVIVSAVSCDSK